ncbi:sensor histidine kinase [Ornithinimicrobium flavum]|uniref:sensor histidine kinase n=1 Tax=Ornithinimicrobium flavum TaxID=1288636 RepID=UPI00106F1015|nr:sensor histidine kinase [Ornithinimicrobium flavum]
MEVLERWFGADEGWERVATADQRRRDVQWAVVAFVIAAIGVELIRAAGGMEEEQLGVGWQYAAVLSGSLLVAFRRVAPVTVMLLAAAHFVVAGQLMPVTMSSLPMQLLAFFLFFSGIAWAQDRRAVAYATLAVLLVMALWLAWWFALGSGLDTIRESLGEDVLARTGPVGPVTALLLYVVLSNLIYFGFAIGLGLVAWRGALQRHRADDLLLTTQEQGGRLRDQAVVAERLRIARELHDVVAHHVSVMGVQAAAARRVLDRDPDAARASLGAIEQSSRDAVGQMRDLLGTLRSEDLEEPQARGEVGGPAGSGEPAVLPGPAAGGGPTDRAPQPTLAALTGLVEQATTPMCTVDLDVVESTAGAAGRVPTPVQLSAYRVVQEALANVRRHSTARHARVTVRIDEGTGRIELEVVDDGHPRWGTSGTGLGLRGMRERAQHLGGAVEAGPRAGVDGYRVRAWFPLEGRARREDPVTGVAVPDPAVSA